MTEDRTINIVFFFLFFFLEQKGFSFSIYHVNYSKKTPMDCSVELEADPTSVKDFNMLE